MSRRKKYRFRTGARFPKDLKAEVLVSEFERVQQRRGRLTAETLLEAASRRSSPLHGLFEWDDTVAAHKYRLEQARMILRSVEIIRGEETPPVRAYLSLEHEDFDDDSYEPTVEIIKDTGKRQQVFLRAYGELVSWRNRYADLYEFAQVFSSVDGLPKPPRR